MTKKQRADDLLVMQGLAKDKEQAQRLIMAGLVSMPSAAVLKKNAKKRKQQNNNTQEQHTPIAGQEPSHKNVPPEQRQQIDKAGQLIAAETPLFLQQKSPYVSRGAYKLLTALETFSLYDRVQGAVALDAGASTGGFTDCLLQHGAARVYAVDVGHGQLHEKLQADARVSNLERTNLRTAESSLIPEQIDILVADVSFISLTLILPNCLRWLKQGAVIAALIKPQFELEAGRTQKGVVHNEADRQEAVTRVLEFCRDTLHLQLVGCTPSRILGPKGNQEYMAVWILPANTASKTLGVAAHSGHIEIDSHGNKNSV